MKKIPLNFLCLNILLIISTGIYAQNWKGGAVFLMDYSLYRWDQRPATASRPPMSDKYSIGQAMNVLPAVYGGAWFGHKKWFLLSVDAGIAYYPFSLDLGNSPKPKGTGVLSFPLMAKFHWLLDASARQQRRVDSKSFMYAGFGQEWVLSGVHVKSGGVAPFPYRLHTVELGVGTGTDGFVSMLFLRGGWGADSDAQKALLFNVGLKFGWEG